MYHENGKIAEEGTWKGSKWVGNYKLYYDNGHVQNEFTFNINGKREGDQKYFYENGQLMIEGSWANGKEAGSIKEYHENGDLKAVKNYANGEVDLASIKTYEPKKPNKKILDEVDKTKKAVARQEEIASIASTKKLPAILNGYYVLYYKNRLKAKDGVFKDSYLIDGKNYIYDSNGILTRIEVYKNGAYVGDAQIDE
jgi:antitoxin component YwqK of YwqJK toxin-antitoxin module